MTFDSVEHSPFSGRECVQIPLLDSKAGPRHPPRPELTDGLFLTSKNHTKRFPILERIQRLVVFIPHLCSLQTVQFSRELNNQEPPDDCDDLSDKRV